MDDLKIPQEALDVSPHRPEEEAKTFQSALKMIDETPTRLALRMQRLGDHRPLGTITRAIQRMAAGETKISGEMQVILQLMIRERERAAEDALKLRWSQVGSNMTAGTKDFAISLSPQTRGGWKVDVTHIPTRFSPDWPVWQTSLDDAKIKAILCIDDAVHDPNPELARILRPHGPAEGLSLEAPAATATDYLDLAGEMNAIALDILERETSGLASSALKISIGLSLQAARLAGEAILASLGWSVADLRKCRNHDLLTVLRQAEAAIRESGDDGLRPYRHFTLVPPMVNGAKLGKTIAAYLQDHLAQGPSGAPENYFNADEPGFSLPRPLRAIYDMAGQLLDAARNVAHTTQ